MSFIFLAALKKFASSDNKSLREASKYALFEINKKEITPEQESELRATAPPTYTEAVAEGAKSNLSGHVMISYQWGSQERALLVRDKLKESGYNVWMDVDEMSKFVLSCFSRDSQTERPMPLNNPVKDDLFFKDNPFKDIPFKGIPFTGYPL